ncbi:MAG: response regulator [Bacillota bacterium]|nr:response regulator [Bacillota bacterium]
MKLNVLIVEDSLFSADIDVREIKKAGFDVDYLIVSSCESMAAALKEKKWDVIISENSMPNFNASMALAVRNKIMPKIPFIIVSEDITDEEVYKALEEGCSAFLRKERLEELRKLVRNILI